MSLVLAVLACAFANVSADEKPARKRSKPPIQRPVQDIETALAQPCQLDFGDDTRISLGELVQNIARTHGVPIRFDKNLAAVLVAARESMLVAEGEIPGAAKVSNSVNKQIASPQGYVTGLPLSIVASPYDIARPEIGSYPQPVQYLTDSPSAPSFSPLPEPGVSPSPVSSQVNPISVAPTYSGNVPPVEGSPTIPTYSANKPVVEEDVTNGEKTNIVLSPAEEAAEKSLEKQLQLSSRVLELLLETEISTVGLNETSASLESVLHHALDHVTSVYDAANSLEGMGLPFFPTHAYDLTLVFEKDHVLITTVAAANLRKTTKVYPVGNLQGIAAEDLSHVITKSIRPWSWRSQINSLVDQVSADWPDSLTLPKIKIDLTGLSTAEGQGDETGEDPAKLDLAGLKTMGQLLSSGTIAAAQAMISGSEMLHYADPPTADIEVLPGILVITQSQGAHREIQQLLDQLAEVTQAKSE